MSPPSNLLVKHEKFVDGMGLIRTCTDIEDGAGVQNPLRSVKTQNNACTELGSYFFPGMKE